MRRSCQVFPLSMRCTISIAIVTALVMGSYIAAAEAGVFRVRDRFNVNTGHGFWMKGRCVLPGGRLGLGDDSALFKDSGCVVRNRKGKRRPRKERGDVRVNIAYFGRINSTGVITEIAGAERECLGVKICRVKDVRFKLEEGALDSRGADIVGMIACIEGRRGIPGSGEQPAQVITQIGTLPTLSNSQRRSLLASLCWSRVLFD